ncbi:hypothetical protein RHMOL_Rhmol07G0008400 [Rhododendron molle]|uniref:Uncharacterized protein n=1 Tax=Rhododendron molle TaxID=49168 RepID=A0ACC0MXH2_RHOML|nr:hypothetical protein RHMOL_Rhmol07G0008400 [Rhododendron molle]
MKKREGSKSNEGKGGGGGGEEESMKIWDCGSPLYDSYELVSLGHVIDRHIMELPSLSGSRGLTKQSSSRSSNLISSKQGGASGFGMAKGSSSTVSCFGEFPEKVLWKTRRVNGEAEEKPKMVKRGVFYRIWKRTGSWRK